MSNRKLITKNKGFTLVELSIVIIIIGFLIAGIAAGQSLIKQATINSVITDMQNFQTAYNGFLLRYGGVPGDITNADIYWPAGSTGCAAASLTCNGNGNGLVEPGNNGAGVDEAGAAWRELALANMINTNIVPIYSFF